ncbi:uncharacterized protein PV09_09291 [Verruconis gallopava]|uniref:Uncharacterized protein n=1 Tax=Verruconis gallopava TaxID=253628 RepID=A0A0D1YE26_9PEZI|nr:uncharacterized protein PV09_09291 [Verruconis gallopava]KIV98956.1 hypothetical protein PV09_09291 [Verruconis gallopava]
MPTRPHQSILEPLPAITRGALRRNESSTHRDLSAFERRVPRSIPLYQPPYQLEGQTLADVLRHASTSATVLLPSFTPISTATANAVSTSVSIPVPTRESPTPLSSPIMSVHSSPVSVTVSITVAPSPPALSAWEPPSLEEFLADIESRRH